MPRMRLTRMQFAVILCIVVTAYASLFATAVRERDGAFFPNSRRPLAPDFAAFYAAGRIVAAGEGQKLYDFDRQQAEQADFLGGVPHPAVSSPYPAWMVAPYAVLTYLSYLPALFVAMLAMGALLVPAIWILCSVSATARADPLLLGLVLTAFWPLFWGIVDGQNTLFSFLCLTGVYAGLRREREIAAGVWLGLLLGKPQLAAVLLGVLAWQRRWRVVGVTAAVGGALSLVGAALAGPGWPVRFVSFALGEAYTTEVDSTGHLLISLPGAAAHLLGAGSRWTTGLTVVTAVAGATAVVYLWRGARYGSAAFPLQFGLAVAVTLAVSPHALFYDAPLLALPVLALLDHWRSEPGGAAISTRRQALVAGFFLAGFGWQLWAVTDVQPLVVLPPLVSVCVAWALVRLPEQQTPNARLEQARESHVEASVAA